MAKVSRKELLKKPDEFITFSARAISFAREHTRYFSYFGIVATGLLLIYLGTYTYLKHINKKGQEAYNIAYYSMVKNMGQEINQDELKKAEEIFKKVTDKYGKSKASRLAIPELAYVKFLKTEYDEAISLYRQFLDSLSDSDPYQPLAKMALAVCYEEKGELEKAAQILEQITSGQDDFFKEQAMLSLSRVYRLSNKVEKSNEILKEFIDKFKTSSFLPLAKAYLRP